MSERLRAVGIDTLKERTNELAYRLVADQYRHVLDRLALPEGTAVVDAGAGIGFYTRILAGRGYKVTAVDISQVALDGIDVAETKICSPLADAKIAPRSAELVHSFDVLYHIMEEAEWRRSLQAVASWSSRYVALHERFLRLPQFLPSRIMKMRTVSQTRRVLADCGFKEIYSVPTYVFSKRLLTYRIADYAPDTFYAVDQVALRTITDTPLNQLGSHHIKVFERV